MAREIAGPESGQGFVLPPHVVERFHQKVAKGAPDECWPWTGAISVYGYGVTSVAAIRRGPIGAHRIAYAIEHGKVPDRKCVMHRCDNPRCCNPAHLRLGSHADNMRDMASKGRHRMQKVRYCRRGHEYTPENTIRDSEGRRGCLKCRTQKKDSTYRRRRRQARRGWHMIARAFFAAHLPEKRIRLNGMIGERHAAVLVRCYGLYKSRPESLTRIADDLGLTRERVRQIRNAACERLGITKYALESVGLLGSIDVHRPEQDMQDAA